jgi:hypothetical protein
VYAHLIARLPKDLRETFQLITVVTDGHRPRCPGHCPRKNSASRISGGSPLRLARSTPRG